MTYNVPMKLRLKLWREKRLLTQRELAVKAGVSHITIAKIETGRSAAIRTARKIAAALDVDPDDLIIHD